MRHILSVDAGGTSTRAALFDASGRCVGFGRAGTGNPTAAGIRGAVDAIGRAAEAALAAKSRVGSMDERGSRAGSSAAIALAGEETAAFHDAVSDRLEPLGFDRVTIVPDLLGMFHSGTSALDGYVLIAGTGAIAARITDGRLDRVAGGAGWLLGDAGSGFWIGHRVAQAVVADLDGLAPSTGLTRMLLGELGIDDDDQRHHGRPRPLRRLVSVLYGQRPVELARFAPLAFTAGDDATANQIVVDAFNALDALLSAVTDAHGDPVARARRFAESDPVVVGGSVLTEGMRIGRGPSPVGDGPLGRIRTIPVEDRLLGRVSTIPVQDGLLGAAVLAHRVDGSIVDAAVFDRLGTSLGAVRSATPKDQ